jgi:tRNA threonylcarbamoyladenosine biosynthesis protein TsaB
MMDKGLQPIALALDSAGSFCSAAVAVGQTILGAERLKSVHGQAEKLLPMVDSAMRQARLSPSELNLVAVAVGPGSFTGIRVGLAAARGIRLATGAELIGVTGFEAVAARIAECFSSGFGYLLVALESRREDLYVQLIDGPRNPLGPPAAVIPLALAEGVNAAIGTAPLLVAGDAAQRGAQVLSKRPQTTVLEDTAPDAVGVLRAALGRWRHGRGDDALRPLYLRPPDVTFPRGRHCSNLKRP